MTIYNPPMSDDAFSPAVGSDFYAEKAAKEICGGVGKLAFYKQKFVKMAREHAELLNSPSGFDFFINGLEGAKKTEGCEWGAKRGRVAEVIRVLKRERNNWIKAKEGIGTPVVSQVDGKTNLTAPTWNPINANWEAVAKDLGNKLTTKEELVSIIKSKMQIAKNKGDYNTGIIAAQNIYDASINGLEANKKAVAWGAKRARVNAAIRLIKNTIRRPETLVDIVGGEVQPIPNKSAEDIAKEQQQTALEKVIDWFGLSPDDDATGGETNGSGEDNKPNYTPLLAGGGVVVAIILVGVLVSAANKGVKPKS